MSTKTDTAITALPLGKAARRAIASAEAEYGIQVATRLANVAAADRGVSREPNGENVCFKSLTSAENVVRAAGISPDRIPVLCKRLRTGTGATVTFGIEKGELRKRLGFAK